MKPFDKSLDCDLLPLLSLELTPERLMNPTQTEQRCRFVDSVLVSSCSGFLLKTEEVGKFLLQVFPQEYFM